MADTHVSAAFSRLSTHVRVIRVRVLRVGGDVRRDVCLRDRLVPLPRCPRTGRVTYETRAQVTIKYAFRYGKIAVFCKKCL